MILGRSNVLRLRQPRSGPPKIDLGNGPPPVEGDCKRQSSNVEHALQKISFDVKRVLPSLRIPHERERGEGWKRGG